MKIKKLFSLLLASVALTSVASATACGKTQTVDENTIIVKVFNGGAGVSWIEQVRDDFNAKNDKYQILLRFDKTLPTGIGNEIKQGYPTADCYFSSGNAFQSSIYKDYLEDLSDILDMEVDGAGKGTIGDKMLNKSQWLAAASKNGQGCYMLPYMDAIFGLVYNHDLFVSKGWLSYADVSAKDNVIADGLEVTEIGNKLQFVSANGFTFYEEGDFILTAGKDGKYGTYDDGQPQTEQEFNTMVNKIVRGNDSAKAFLYNGVYDHYTNGVAEAIAAQYMGVDMYKAIYSYNTNGDEMPLYDGTSVVITPENGYNVYNSMGIYKGLEFVKTYLDDKDKVDANSFKTTSYSHTDAQNDFILSFKKSTGYPAMLCEGVWWENEAREMFSEVVKDGNPDYGYGKQDFRYMLYPNIEGQYGVDGNGNGTVMTVSDAAATVVPKGLSAEKLAKVKEFIAMTMTDEVMINFTKTTGIMRPYNYQLTDADLLEMTPFQRAAWKIYNDKDNISIVTPSILKGTDPLTYTTSITDRSFPVKMGATYATSYIRALRDAGSISNLYSKSNVGYSAAEWSEFLAQAKKNGFFN